jgi:predicted nuclease of restriction endonuclease-like RecB superfamily
MLTGKQVRVRFGRNNRLTPSYIDHGDPSWLAVAERLLELYRGQESRTRGELEEEIYETFSGDPRQLVHNGLAKLLEDRCEFDVVSGHPPEPLRELVFRAAAKARQAPVAFERDVLLQEVATQLQMTPTAVEQGLFADLKSEQRLVRFKDISAERLLQRYNVALAQAVLLRATRVRVHVRRETPQRYRQLMRHIKFHRLICEVTRTTADSYCLQLDGPLSLFSATQKYGLQLALFLPAILQCRDFEVEAELRWGPQRKLKQFFLSTEDGLVWPFSAPGSHVPAELTMFAELFRKRAEDWEIAEETDVLPLGDSFWVPDYRLVHRASGKAVLLEVLGFWRRSSAERHLARLREHATMPFLLAVSDQLHIDDAELEGLPAGIHRFRQMPLPDEVVRLAEELV